MLLAALRQSPDATLLLDTSGHVRFINDAARAYLGLASALPIHRSLWQIVDAKSGNWWRNVVERVGDTRAEVRETMNSHAGLVEWAIRPVQQPDGELLGVFAEGRRIEAPGTDDEAALLLRLALALGHTDSLELAIAAVLRTVCEAFQWVMGEAWLPDSSMVPPRLTRAAIWTVRDRRIESFAAQGLGFSFERSDGLPGTAWERRELVWERPLSAARHFTRAPLAAAAGLKAAVAVPVMAGDEVVAVLSFYATDAQSEDSRFTRVMSVVGAQLGPLILQKRAEETHRVAEARLSGIISIAVDAIISIDQDRRITMFNWGAEQIFGYTAEEILGQQLDILLPPESRDRHAAHVAHFAGSSQVARRMGERSPIVGLRKSGEVFPAEASISRFQAGGHWIFTVTLRDITARKRTEEGLRFLAETGQLLSDLIRNPTSLQRVAERAVPTLGDICTIDVAVDKNITMVALAARTPAIAATAQSARERTPLTWDADDPIVHSLRDGAIHVQTRPDGSTLAVPLVAQGKTLGAISFAMMSPGRHHDEMYRALAEELAGRVALAVDGAELFQRTRRAVSARDEVLAVVSHDLRNPLSAINMCVGALRESAADPETTRDLLGTVADSAGLMARIIQDLLDVASIDAGKLSIERRSQSLAPVLANGIAMFEAVATERGLTLDIDSPASLPAVAIDADRILQVIANLLHNACKFTPTGGSVHIQAAAVADAVQVAVSDTGAGIAPEDLPRVFDRFWHDRHAARIRSTGLGLAIARGIVEAHAGRIWVESTPGKGSTFTFTIPITG